MFTFFFISSIMRVTGLDPGGGDLVDAEKRERLERKNAYWQERLEQEILDGGLGENPSDRDKAAWVNRKRNIEKANNYNKNFYDQMTFRLRKDGGVKNYGLSTDMIRRAAKAAGLGVNDYILRRLSEALDARGELFASSDQGSEDAMLFLPEDVPDPILIDGDDALLLRDLAESCDMSLENFVMEAALEKAERFNGTNKFGGPQEGN